MFGSPAGSGVLANPVQNPIGQAPQQNLPANWQEVLKNLGALWGAQGQLGPAMFKAMTLRHDQPYNAKGAGPLGIRIGEGPGGWAVSIGDLVAGLKGRKMQEEADAKAMAAQKALAEASGGYAQEKLRFPNFVPQGAPIGGVDDPLGVR